MTVTLLDEAGRKPGDVGLEARIPYGTGDPGTWETAVREWQAEGATHLSFNSMSSGFKTPQEHIEAIKKFAEII